MTDCYGTPLALGQIVAYNMSGNVVRGQIVKLGPPIHIALSGDMTGNPAIVIAGYTAGHISKVRHPTSVLVLKD